MTIPDQPDLDLNYCAILNPASRSGNTGKDRSRIIEALGSLTDRLDVLITSAPGDASRLAFDASARYDVVIAVGGDGTINEVASGLLKRSTGAALAVIPTGTGNDFARMIGMPATLDEAIKVLYRDRRITVDAGFISWNSGSSQEHSLFVNAAGIGFDGYAASLAPLYKHLPFKSGYLVTVLKALLSWKSFPATIESDERLFYEGDVFMLTVSNAMDSGGGFRINPKASLTDELLDACLVKGIGLIRALRLLPQAVRGSHLGLDEVEYWQVPNINIKTKRPVPVHVDGEILTLGATDITLGIRAGALSVVVPKHMIPTPDPEKSG